jgi:hypothetical protein
MNPHPDLTLGVINGLGWLYLLMFFLNVGWTVRSYRLDGEFNSLAGISHAPKATLWALLAGLYLLLAITHLTFHSRIRLTGLSLIRPSFLWFQL